MDVKTHMYHMECTERTIGSKTPINLQETLKSVCPATSFLAKGVVGANPTAGLGVVRMPKGVVRPPPKGQKKKKNEKWVLGFWG
jgi:hypothetical protein